MDKKERIKELITQKDKIEEEIKEHHGILSSQGNIGMNEPLVDSEGYPRSDIDVYQVRISRHKIACLQNDHKNLMKQIEEELHILHSESKNQTADSTQIIDISVTTENHPFLTINLVSRGSPAEEAGLLVGDEITNFGSVNKLNFQNIQSIGTVVQHSEGKNIEVKVLRGGQPMRLLLKPKKWSGRGLLGCNIVPISA